MEFITRELNGGRRGYSPSEYCDGVLRIVHSCGFLSCATIALQDIMVFYNDYGRLPEKVDRSRQFISCKSDSAEDISEEIYDAMKEYEFGYDRERMIIGNMPRVDSSVPVGGTYPAHGIYRDILFDDIGPFLKKYFSPSEAVIQKADSYSEKYQIDFENTCYILYRGIEKQKEVPIGSHEFFIEKAKSIDDGKMFFLIQTDESDFIASAKSELKNVIFIEECLSMPKDPSTPIFEKIGPEIKREHLLNYFASIIIGSKCKHAITHTGNGGLWLSLYRGKSKNLHQAAPEWIYEYSREYKDPSGPMSGWGQGFIWNQSLSNIWIG